MNIRRLVLGTAAGALAVTGAQAADLPVVVEPIDYVRICDAYGEGFFFIPGTETCLRVGGRIRTDYNVYFDFEDDDTFFDDFGFDSDERGYRFRARGYLRLDSRTSTELGLLRTYLDAFGTRDSGAFGDDGDTNSFFEVDTAIIQLGGLVFGRTTTFFGYGGGVYTPEQTFDLGNNTGVVNLVGYTFSFGNGFSAGIALEDNTKHRDGISARALRRPAVFGFETVTDARYRGAHIPDVVANVGIEQGWGSAQVMGALHYVNGALFVSDVFDLEDIDGDGDLDTVAGTGLSRVIEDEELGWAVGAGVEVNVPFGNGTQFGIQGGYSQGALDYIADGPSGLGAVDAVWAGNDLELGDFYSIAGGFATSFTPTLVFAAGAGYVNMDHELDTFDTQNINANVFLAYAPVEGFELGIGAEYRYIDTDADLFDGELGDAFDDDDNLSDGDALTVFFRAQRTF